MKNILMVLAGLLVVGDALACMPPRTRYMAQSQVLESVLPSISKKIEELAGLDEYVKSLTLLDTGEYAVSLSNGCVIIAKGEYRSRGSRPGMCPEFVGVNVTSAKCE